jgi:hypothetical protein
MNLFYKDIEICVTITSPLRKSRIQRILIFRICWSVDILILSTFSPTRSCPVLDRIPYHKSQKPHQIMCLPNFSRRSVQQPPFRVGHLFRMQGIWALEGRNSVV